MLMSLAEALAPRKPRRRVRRGLDRLHLRRSDLPDLPDASQAWHRVRDAADLPAFVATAVAGTVASLVSAAALGLIARAEGRPSVVPINATSHWLNGPQAGDVEQLDLRHTVVGAATHHLSSLFWALPYGLWLTARRDRSPTEVVAGAAGVAGIAAVVDYGLMPRRLTPGWEHSLSPRAVAAGFGALALGLAAGGLLAEALRRR